MVTAASDPLRCRAFPGRVARLLGLFCIPTAWAQRVARCLCTRHAKSPSSAAPAAPLGRLPGDLPRLLLGPGQAGSGEQASASELPPASMERASLIKTALRPGLAHQGDLPSLAELSFARLNADARSGGHRHGSLPTNGRAVVGRFDAFGGLDSLVGSVSKSYVRSGRSASGQTGSGDCRERRLDVVLSKRPGQNFPGEPIGLPLDPPGPFLFLSDPFGLLSNFAAGSLAPSRYHPAQPPWAL